MITRDFRHAVVGLRRRRAFATTAILSLGVGIAAATTVMSVVIALFVRPLPYADPSRLVSIWPGKVLAGREIDALQREVTTVREIASLSPGWLMPLTHVGVPRQLDAGRVAGNLFGLLGVSPLLGHAFGSDADAIGRDHVAVLSYELWHSAFGGDPSIIGRSIVLDDESYAVVAVMPRSFRALAFTSDVWIPLTTDPGAPWWTQATGAAAYGRLAPGVTTQRASTELAVVAGRIQQEFHLAPDWPTSTRVVGLKRSMVGALEPLVLLLTGGVGLLLALAGANVTTLLLVRAAERRSEIAVRAALGATPRRIAALVAAESLAIGVGGGIVGMALSRIGVSLLLRILPPALPRRQEIVLDLRVLLAASALTLVVAVLAGLLPAWQASVSESSDRLRVARTVAARGERTRGLLVSLEMALALILAVGAALMGRTLVAISHVDPGLEADHLLTMKVQPSGSTGDDRLRLYWRAVLARVDDVPGVRSAATILHLPEGGRSWSKPIEIEGHPLPPGEAPPLAHWETVSSSYFQTAGVRLLSGRLFSESDGPAAPPVIAINTALADRIFPGVDPVGHRISAGYATGGALATIVGVVGSVRQDSLTGPAAPEIYVPFAQCPVYATSLVVRTVVSPVSLAPAIRAAVWSVDRTVPVSDVRTMADLLAASLATQHMVLILFAAFAGIGLLLSAIGVYGVVAFGAAQRTKELGIRVALGATAGMIQRVVAAHGLRYASLGVVVGVAIAFALSHLMRTFVYGVPPTDAVSFILAPLVLLGVVGAASWFPARRAARLDPTTALAE